MNIEFIAVAFALATQDDGPYSLADISMVRFICGFECYCGIFHAEDMTMMLNTINK